MGHAKIVKKVGEIVALEVVIYDFLSKYIFLYVFFVWIYMHESVSYYDAFNDRRVQRWTVWYK